MWRDLGDRLGVMVDLSRIAGVLAVAGRAEAAARVLSRADALREETGAAFEPWNVRMNEETLAAIRAQFDEGAISEAWEQGRELTLDQAVMLALESLGVKARSRGPASREPS